MIIVGSTAMKYHKLINREPNDFDVWLEEGELIPYKSDHCCIPKSVLDLVEVSDGYATIDSLYTIKVSHLGWDIFFDKHKQDVLLLKHNGAKLIPELYKELLKFWKIENGNKDFLSLYKDKGEFFNDYVTYVYDHDYLHELVAYPDKPMYTHCLKDGEQVAIDKDKFNNLTFEQQVKMFREEVIVIAVERWLVNLTVINKPHWIKAYQWSLRKTITALTKNWATEFLVLNIEHFVKPDYNEFKNILTTLGVNDMSNKIDTTPLENLAKEIGREFDKDFVLALATEDDINFVEWSNNVDYKEWKAANNDKTLEVGYEHIYKEGGGEGGGEYVEAVFKIKGVAYKTSWSYYSHHGYEYDDIISNLRIVEPKEKTITVWE